MEALVAGVGPLHPASSTTSRAYRSVSLLPLVRGALEGLLFDHTTSTSSGGGLGVAGASVSSHVHAMLGQGQGQGLGQGQGHVYPSPLHLWFAHWRRASTSTPLTRLISNILITLLHDQCRLPGSLATTLHVPHTGWYTHA